MSVISKLIDLHGRATVAHRMGVSRAATYKWEAGRVSAERALQIHKEFGIPTWKLRPDLWAPPQRKSKDESA